MQYMFSDCSRLRSLNISNFNTSNETNIDLMFYGCNELKSNVTTKDKKINDKYVEYIKKNK